PLFPGTPFKLPKLALPIPDIRGQFLKAPSTNSYIFFVHSRTSFIHVYHQVKSLCKKAGTKASTNMKFRKQLIYICAKSAYVKPTFHEKAGVSSSRTNEIANAGTQTIPFPRFLPLASRRSKTCDFVWSLGTTARKELETARKKNAGVGWERA
ncbi:hypothetical protein GQ44DRAFT_67968, partial [Phaeosphaeriaceae sp. PMI808]